MTPAAAAPQTAPVMRAARERARTRVVLRAQQAHRRMWRGDRRRFERVRLQQKARKVLRLRRTGSSRGGGRVGARRPAVRAHTHLCFQGRRLQRAQRRAHVCCMGAASRRRSRCALRTAEPAHSSARPSHRSATARPAAPRSACRTCRRRSCRSRAVQRLRSVRQVASAQAAAARARTRGERAQTLRARAVRKGWLHKEQRRVLRQHGLAGTDVARSHQAAPATGQLNLRHGPHAARVRSTRDDEQVCVCVQ